MRKINRDAPVVVTDLAIRSMISNAIMLSNPLRLSILMELFYGKLKLPDFCRSTRQSKGVLNPHLALLKISGLIEIQRVGRFAVYSLADAYRGLIGDCRDHASKGRVA